MKKATNSRKRQRGATGLRPGGRRVWPLKRQTVSLDESDRKLGTQRVGEECGTVSRSLALACPMVESGQNRGAGMGVYWEGT